MDRPTLYGIANCDTIRKARNWLAAHDVEYNFHDYRKQGVSRVLLESMIDELGWEALLNRRGTTWRRLPEADREDLGREKSVRIMLDHPAIIKRPVLRHGNHFILGFDEARYAEIFNQS